MQIAPSARKNNNANPALADKYPSMNTQKQSNPQRIDLIYDNELFKKLLQPALPAAVGSPLLSPATADQHTDPVYIFTAQIATNNMPQLCTELQKVIEDRQWSAQLYLPAMGEVNVLIKQTTGNELSISLAFNPAIIALVEPHKEYCRKTLNRRLNKKIRLYFRQKDTKSQETD
ncbi:MAG: hypothetical protein P4L95_08105 [Rouxiella aceris]|uniref:hypothetical protein n=1 Tax=Rouxiella aceris TaxID=2703884 RepID=UPI002840EA9B|nr:hypothetical protein [Rouxiella aceris]MDR3431848.1 hypothetical protein [Rouxiella aceris]